MVFEDYVPLTLGERFRASMRATAASISLVTSTDVDGKYHGMAATSWASMSMDPPSMLVAVNRSASVHAVISASRRYCLNLMRDSHSDILERFSRSDMRDVRFNGDQWRNARGLPVLRGALASQLCSVDASYDYGTHTIFVGRVDDVILLEPSSRLISPLIWVNGSRASITCGSVAE